jgi:hypothetical protein
MDVLDGDAQASRKTQMSKLSEKRFSVKGREMEVSLFFLCLTGKMPS